MLGKNINYIMTDTNIMINISSLRYVSNMLTSGGVI